MSLIYYPSIRVEGIEMRCRQFAFARTLFTISVATLAVSLQGRSIFCGSIQLFYCVCSKGE